MAFDDGQSWVSAEQLTSSADMSGADANLTTVPTLSLKLDDLIISVDTAMRVDIKEETSGTIFFSGYFPANSGPIQCTPRNGFAKRAAGKRLLGRTSAAGNIRIFCSWHEVP